jgi:GT2 family glycosyltransferase
MSAGNGDSSVLPPKLSIIVPVYNRETTVTGAIASAIAAADASGQPPGAIEIIVVDDGSSDDSAAAASAALAKGQGRVAGTVVIQKNAGPAAARNHGVSLSRAPHLAFLDSDDLWFSWTIRSCLDAIDAHPEAALYFLKPVSFSRSLPLQPQQGFGANHVRFDSFVEASLAHTAWPYGTSIAMVSRDAFTRLGGFDENFVCLEDTDLFIRLDAQGPCVLILDGDLVGRRQGEGDSLTNNWACVRDGLMNLKRKEAAGGYPGGAGGDPRRSTIVAVTAVKATRLCFANGATGSAYAMLFGNLGPIIRGGRSRWLWRLALTPALSLVRPKNFPFRLRRAIAPEDGELTAAAKATATSH